MISRAALGAAASTTQKRPVPAKDVVPAKRRFTLPLIAAAVVIVAVFLAAKFAGRPSQSAPETASTQTAAAPQPSESNSAPALAPPQPSSPTAEAPRSTEPSTSGAVLKQVVPDVSRSARNTIQGTVRVSVIASVDSSGNVSAARFENRGPSAYFANLAMKSAKDWKFKSPQVDGREVASNWTLHFDFKRGGTSVRPIQTSLK